MESDLRKLEGFPEPPFPLARDWTWPGIFAATLAKDQGQSMVDVEHLLGGLYIWDSEALEEFWPDRREMRRCLRAIAAIDRAPLEYWLEVYDARKAEGDDYIKVSIYTPRLAEILRSAEAIARENGRNAISILDVLQAVRGSGSTLANQLLQGGLAI